MIYKITYNLGCIVTTEVNTEVNHFEHTNTLTRYWHPFMSELAYLESLNKNMKFDIPYILSDDLVK